MNFEEELERREGARKVLLDIIHLVNLGITHTQIYIPEESKRFHGLTFQFEDFEEKYLDDEDKEFLYLLFLKALDSIRGQVIAAVEKEVKDGLKSFCETYIQQQEKKIEEAKELISYARKRLEATPLEEI